MNPNSLILYVSLLFLSGHILSAELNRNEIVVAYINNFCKNIEWPGEDEFDDFRLTVVGDASGDIMTEFDRFSKTRTVRGKEIKLNAIDDLEDGVEYSHIYFLDEPGADNLKEFFKKLKGRPILVVTFEAENRELTMINIFSNNNSRLLFEVNESNLQSCGLVPSEALLSYAANKY